MSLTVAWTVLSGAATFLLTNLLAGLLVPAAASRNQQQRWKWRNVATSLVHSVITGLWALAAFYQTPDMLEDLQWRRSDSSHGLVCFSIGYFLYDAADMIVNHRKKSTYELLLHHSLVILCYSVAVLTTQFVAFVALSLVVEINSVFLHGRQLLIITSEPRSSGRYRANALLNIITFLVFRIFLLAYLTHWIARESHRISLGFLVVAFIGLGVIDIMNIVLFCRILYVDFETLKPKILEKSALISTEDKNQNISLQPVQVQNNPVAVGRDQDSQTDCDFDFPSEESLCGKSPDNLINQNISNGCHQRRQWSEHIVVDNNRD